MRKLIFRKITTDDVVLIVVEAHTHNSTATINIWGDADTLACFETLLAKLFKIDFGEEKEFLLGIFDSSYAGGAINIRFGRRKGRCVPIAVYIQSEEEKNIATPRLENVFCNIDALAVFLRDLGSLRNKDGEISISFLS